MSKNMNKIYIRIYEIEEGKMLECSSTPINQHNGVWLWVWICTSEIPAEEESAGEPEEESAGDEIRAMGKET